jgi:hypothetical protein
MPTPTDGEKGTDDVAGAARPAPGDVERQPLEQASLDPDAEAGPFEDEDPGPDAGSPPPPQVEELAAACVRFVAARYGATLDFEPDTLSFVDHWVREGRAELAGEPRGAGKPEAVELVQATAGAYLGEVVRRFFGARWVAEGEHPSWKLCMSNVYCAFNPIGMAREAVLLEPAEGWHAHLELDPAEREAVEARLAALPEVDDDEYYAPTTRFDVLCILVDALRASMRARGLGDVRFTPDDYR